MGGAYACMPCTCLHGNGVAARHARPCHRGAEQPFGHRGVDEDGEPAYNRFVAEARLEQHLALLAGVRLGGWLSWDQG